jgi:hypothetical protein
MLSASSAMRSNVVQITGVSFMSGRSCSDAATRVVLSVQGRCRRATRARALHIGWAHRANTRLVGSPDARDSLAWSANSLMSHRCAAPILGSPTIRGPINRRPTPDPPPIRRRCSARLRPARNARRMARCVPCCSSIMTISKPPVPSPAPDRSPKPRPGDPPPAQPPQLDIPHDPLRRPQPPPAPPPDLDHE